MLQNIIRNGTCIVAALTFSSYALMTQAAEVREGIFTDASKNGNATVRSLLTESATIYRSKARYPDGSQMLKAFEEDPVKAKRTPTRQQYRGPRGGDYQALTGMEPNIQVWPAQVNFEYPKPAVIHASLVQNGAPILGSLTSGRTNLSGEIILQSTREVVGTVEFFDNGVGPDRRKNDGVFTAVAEFMENFQPELASDFSVRVTAQFADSNPAQAMSGFLYSNPWGKLTGKFADRADNGNLVYMAQVEVEKAGKFHISGTVTNMKGKSIGTASASVELEPGIHWVDLSFYGLMFHDRKQSGPYQLKSVSFNTTSGFPNALSDLVENAHISKPYKLFELNNKAFNNPSLMQAADQLERAAVRSAASKNKAAK